jgi:glycosyltransferase involved in cell wall biosynthesis
MMAKTRYFGGTRYRFRNVPKNPAPKAAIAAVPKAASRPFPTGLVVFSSGKERCGINEYSKGLDAQIRSLGVQVSEENLDQTALLASAPAGAEVLVHLEPSLLGPGFDQALRAAYQRRAKIVGCFHYCDPNFFRRFVNYTDLLVTHRDYGISHPKLRQLPLACPTYTPPNRAELRSKFGFPEDVKVLTSLGFLTRWKKIPELVTQLLPELARRNIKLQLLCPMHFSGDPHREMDRLRKLVQGQSSVIWHSNFLPEQEMLERVAASDLGLVYHGEDTGSCSAANKMFVSARCPILLTSSNHDSDVQHGAEHLKSFDLGQFAQRALELIEDEQKLAALRIGIERDYELLNQRAVAQRYLELFKEIRK